MSGSPAPAATAAASTTIIVPARNGLPAVDGFIDLDRAAKDTSIDAVDFSGELDRQPGLVYFYTAAAAKAERQLSTLKLRLEATEADRATKIRQAAVTAGEKVTVDDLKSRVRLDTTVVAVETLVIKAQEVLSVLKGICEAMRHKRDMLVMRGHMTRDEIKAQLDAASQSVAPVSDGLRDRDRRLKERLGDNTASVEA